MLTLQTQPNRKSAKTRPIRTNLRFVSNVTYFDPQPKKHIDNLERFAHKQRTPTRRRNHSKGKTQ